MKAPLRSLIVIVSLALLQMTGAFGQTSDALLAQKARSVAKKDGFDVWKTLALGGPDRDRTGKTLQQVAIYSTPHRVASKLCKANYHLYNVYQSDDGEDWRQVKIPASFINTVAAVVPAASGRLCRDTPVRDYFDVHDPIEDNTLVALYEYVKKQVYAGRVDSISASKFHVQQIRLALRHPMPVKSFMYSVALKPPNGRVIPVTLYISLKSAEFSVIDR